METNLGFPYPESEMADAAAFQSFIMEIQQGKMPKIVLLYSRYLMKYSKITNNRTLSSNSLFLHNDAHNIRIHVRLLDTLENVVYYKEIYFSVKMFEVLHPLPLR